MANITAGDGSNTFEQGRLQIRTLPAGMAVFLAALNIFLSITASLGNALILIALHKVSSIYPPTKLFFRCLAVTDLCVGLISQPLTAINLIAVITNVNENLLYFASQVNRFSRFSLSAVSILTSTAISVDRLLALLLGMRYRHVVTLRRVRAVIICIWLLSCALGGWRYSAVTTRSLKIARTVFIVVMSLSLLTSVFSYIKIYFLLRHHHQVQVHAQQGQPPNAGEIPLNIARYKKMVSSIAWVQLALFACYYPYSVVGMLLTYGKIHGSVAYFRATVSLLYLNSSLNPILYGWRIREVKQAVKDTIIELICCKAN